MTRRGTPAARRLALRSCASALALVASASSLAFVPPARASGDVGFRDFSYVGTTAPTGQKPQSKLWFNDGAWWGALYDSASTDFHIFRHEATTDAWIDTGTLIDERSTARLDVLWDGSALYVAAAGTKPTTLSHSGRVRRYSYDSAAQRYTQDAGFPVTVSTGGMEAIVLAKDTVGSLWVTFTQSNQALVAHSTTDDRTWTAPYALPVPGSTTLDPDDISAVVSFDSKIGVMWSNQNEDTMYFATHDDGTPDDGWEVHPALSFPEYADDHINIKSLESDVSGRVFAAVKTSLNAPNDPLILVLVLGSDGQWSNHTFGRVADAHSRPIILLDQENRDVYVFATSPCCSGGTIYYKRSSLDDISFPPGLGTPFIQTATDPKINNPTSTKQTLDSTTDLMVMAGDDSTRYYLHNSIDLGASSPAPSAPPGTTITSGPEGTVATGSASFTFTSDDPGATFECSWDGLAFGSCSTPASRSGLADGPHRFEVRAVAADGRVDASPASRSWTVSATLFADGFESGDLSAWTSVQSVAGGTVVVQGATVKSGSFAARLTTGGRASVAAIDRGLGSPRTDLTVSADVLLAGTGDWKGPVIELLDPAGAPIVRLSQQKQLTVDHSAARYRTAASLPVDTWANVQVRAVAGGPGASLVEVRVDGTIVYQTGTASLGATGALTVRVGGAGTGRTSSLLVDDVRVGLS